ncbi:nuclear transport factor 2 family protein [Temperatibacter marinus]|uniref:Nuclear transport factor 2 family protein n=1 Tax=Temperatibacter marinus TaxID=1456591 RepID=A0AA52EHG7_9PROT|nr:nuclear transport factor 2 family protein [Temperatibacter marinus]WND02860.1 nuclear transport factor 2 family protein [Temperatibacter marinus]
MYKFLLLVCLIFSSPSQANDLKATDALLDDLHRYAATGDWDQYFPLFGKNAIFIGTDAKEYWTLEEFEAFARKYSGWVYTPQSRQTQFNQDNTVAWFHEIVLSEKYGTARGTGTLLKTAKGWKISQYTLTFPIPNDIAKSVTEQIKSFEKKEK